jgi:hypothetical protein
MTKLAKLNKVQEASPGSRTVRRIIEDEFGIDFDPLIELIRLARRTDKDAVAAKCYADAAKYCHPQLKSMEINKKVLHGVMMGDSELANRFRQYMLDVDKTENPMAHVIDMEMEEEIKSE